MFHGSVPARWRQSGLLLAGLLLTAATIHSGLAGEHSLMNEGRFRAELSEFQSARGPAEQRRRANALIESNAWFSSQQVKTIALQIQDEEVRFDFALAVHPRTVDPENFYDVYDAFAKFSTVFRLHDRIHGRIHEPSGPGVVAGPQPASEAEVEDILRALKAEPFDDARLKQARQIVTARPRFTARQVREFLKLFAFDNSRLELAKAAYDHVLDPENYYQVNEAFSFSNNREALAAYIEKRRAEAPEHR